MQQKSIINRIQLWRQKESFDGKGPLQDKQAAQI